MHRTPLLDAEAAAYKLNADGFFVEPDAALAKLLLGSGQFADRLVTKRLSDFFVIDRMGDTFYARAREAQGRRVIDYIRLCLSGATAHFQCITVWRPEPDGEQYSGLLLRFDRNDQQILTHRAATLIGEGGHSARREPRASINILRSNRAQHGGTLASADAWKEAEEWQRHLKFSLNLWLLQHNRQHPDDPLAHVRPTDNAVALQARLDVFKLRDQASRLRFFEQSVAQTVAARNTFEAAAFYRYDGWSGNLILRAEYGLPQGTYLPLRISPELSPDLDEMIGDPLLSPESWPQYWGPKESAGQRLVPMTSEGRLVGCIWAPMANDAPKDEWLQAFCEFLCVVIPGAEREAAEGARARSQAKAMEVLVTREPAHFYEKFRRLLEDELDVEGSSIFSVQMRGNEPRLVLAASSGIQGVPEARWREVTYRLGEGLTGIMAQAKREPITFLNVAKERERRGLGSPQYTEALHSAPASWLGCPVLGKQRELIAYIRLVNRRVGERPIGGFSDGDITLVSAVATVIAQFHELQATQRRNEETVSRSFHDLFAPVVAIKSHISWLARNLDSPRALIKCQNIRNDAEYLIGLLDTIRFSSRNEAPQREPTLLYSHVIVPLRHGMSELARRYGYRGLELKASQMENLPAIDVDRDMIRQVFYNLIVNAIKYGSDSEGSVVVVEISGRVHNKTVQIAVRDHGIGISEQDEPRIFEQHYRGAEAERRDPSGSGIGLFVTRNVLEKHGGSIRVGNRRKPTEFVLVLPTEVM